MSDFTHAAASRIVGLVETIEYEAEGIDDLEKSIESGRLIVAARSFRSACEAFVEALKADLKRETK